MPGRDEHDRRERAFLALLRHAEFGGREDHNVYHSLYGNGHFANLTTHPNKKVTRWGHVSTAAGAYGTTKPAYDDAVKHGVIHDFSEASQDKIALFIIHHREADQAIQDGDLDTAFALLHGQWSSLPGGSQHELTPEQAKAYFWKQLDETPP